MYLQAEKINGRACMVGYALGYFVDVLTGHGLVDQQNSFLGKVLLNVTVIGLLIMQHCQRTRICWMKLPSMTSSGRQHGKARIDRQNQKSNCLYV